MTSVLLEIGYADTTTSHISRKHVARDDKRSDRMSAPSSSALAVLFVGLKCLALILLLFDTAMAAQLTLTWLGTDGAAEYAVERELASLGTFAQIARVVGATSYVDSGVLAGLTYCYRVRAASTAGYS